VHPHASASRPKHDEEIESHEVTKGYMSRHLSLILSHWPGGQPLEQSYHVSASLSSAAGSTQACHAERTARRRILPISGSEPAQGGGSLTRGPGGIRSHGDRVVSCAAVTARSQPQGSPQRQRTAQRRLVLSPLKSSPTRPIGRAYNDTWGQRVAGPTSQGDGSRFSLQSGGINGVITQVTGGCKRE